MNTKYFNNIIILVLVLFCASLFVANSSAMTLKENVKDDANPKAEYAPGRLIVKLKEGKAPDDIKVLNDKYNVISIEKVFKKSTNPEDILKHLQERLSGLNKGHKSWYWQLDKDSQEYKDYAARIKNEKNVLEKQIKVQEELIARLRQRQKRAPASSDAPNLENIYLLKIGNGIDILRVVSDYKNNPAVEYSEPDYIVKKQMVPNDQYYLSGNSWGQGYDDLWGIKKIQCEQAWDISQGEGIIVAVVDTGIDYNHEDIAANVWINEREIPDNGLDDDGNSFIDDVRGWDFAYGDNDPKDGDGHGTHVSGTIAAIGNNSIGVVGVAPKAKIMAVKGLNDEGSGDTSNLAECIRYAADNGADILNNSWGGYGSSGLIDDAINYAYSSGCVIVVAAGNSNSLTSEFFPASNKNAITVAAFDHNSHKCSFSNYGENIYIAAPGGGIDNEFGNGRTDIYNILSTSPDGASISVGNPELKVSDNYYRLAGTSMAAPHVAAVCALILAKNPSLTNEQIKYVLRVSADDIKDPLGADQDWSGFDVYSGHGMLNAYKAVQVNDIPIIVVPKVKITSPYYGEYLKTYKIDIYGTASGEYFKSYKLKYKRGSNLPVTFYTSEQQVENGYLGTLDLDALGLSTNIGREIILSVEDSSGAVYNDSVFTLHYSGMDRPGWPVKIAPGFSDSSPVIADINEDGFSEVVAVDASGDIHVFKSDGSYLEGWPKHVDNLTVYGITVCSPAVGDLDLSYPGLEIVVGTMRSGFYGESYVYAFHADGTFVAGWPAKRKGHALGVGIVNGRQPSPTLADIDSDGFLEVIIGSWEPRLYVFNHDGTIHNGWPVTFDEDIDGVAMLGDVAVADLDKERPGLEIIARTWNNIYAFYSDGSVLSGWPVPLLIKMNEGWASPQFDSPTIGDLDCDGQLETVVVDSKYIHVLNKNGQEINGKPISIDDDLNLLRIDSEAALFNIDDDQDLEIVVFLSVGYDPNAKDKKTFRGFNYDGSLVENTQQGINQANSVTLADIDGDGLQDIVFTCDTGSNMKGYGGWLSILLQGVGWRTWGTESANLYDDNFYSQPAIGDLDNDGNMEIVVATRSNGMGETFGPYLYCFNYPAKFNPAGMDSAMYRVNPQKTGYYLSPLYVDLSDIYEGLPDGTKRRPFKTVQQAIENAVSGQRILVAAGTYYGPITINKNIVLSGDSPETTILDCAAGSDTVIITKEAGAGVLQNFTIKNSGGQVWNAAIRYYGKNFKISNNTISNNKGYGIYCGGGASPIILNNKITDCIMPAIYLSSCWRPYVFGNIISNMSGADGILCAGHGGYGEFKNNIIVNNWCGVHILQVRSPGYPIFENNTIDNNKGYGVWLEDSYGTFINNIISNNGRFYSSNDVQGHGVSAQNWISYKWNGEISTFLKSEAILFNNDVWNNRTSNYDADEGSVCSPGEGDISVDPQFVGGVSFDYHIQPASPCIGAGRDAENIGAVGVKMDAVSNHAPQLNVIGNKTVEEGKKLEFVISASDADGDSLSYSASLTYVVPGKLPDHANFDSPTNTFSFAPTYDCVGSPNKTGTYRITFTVSDGSLSDSETIEITVIDAPPMTISISLEGGDWLLKGVKLGSDFYNTYDGTRYGIPKHVLKNTGNVDIKIDMRYAGFTGLEPSYDTLVDHFQTSVGLESGHLITIQPPGSPHTDAVIRQNLAVGTESLLLIHYIAPTELTKPISQMNAIYEIRAYEAIK